MEQKIRYSVYTETFETDRGDNALSFWQEMRVHDPTRKRTFAAVASAMEYYDGVPVSTHRRADDSPDGFVYVHEIKYLDKERWSADGKLVERIETLMTEVLDFSHPIKRNIVDSNRYFVNPRLGDVACVDMNNRPARKKYFPHYDRKNPNAIYIERHPDGWYIECADTGADFTKRVEKAIQAYIGKLHKTPILSLIKKWHPPLNEKKLNGKKPRENKKEVLK